MAIRTHYPDGTPALVTAPHPIYNPPPSSEQLEIARLQKLNRKLAIALAILFVAGTVQWLAFVLR